MISLKTLLTELIVKDLSTGEGEKTFKYILVYKGHLFIFDHGSDIDPIKKSLKGHPDSEYIIDAEGVDDLISSAATAAPDILVGSWYPEKRGLVVGSETEIVPQSSLNVKKAAQKLGVKTVTYFSGEGDDDVDIPSKKLVGGIPKRAFHGTASEQLKSILTYGLDPGRGPGRFSHRGVEHEDHIFLAATFEATKFYAEHAVRISKKTYDNFPIILELTIPDPNLLVPDFDADISTSEKRYYKIGSPMRKASMKNMGLSRETGKWGYKGRIPASFIKWVYYYNTYQKKWHRSRPDVWRRLLEKYDWETIGYKLGLMDFIKPSVDSFGRNIPYWE